MTEQSMAFTRDLPLPDAFSAGQVFAFSGMAGENSCAQDWCGALTGNAGEIRFDGGILLRFSDRASGYDVVLPDLIAADGGAILVTFADAQTIVGRSDTLPALCTEGEDYVSGSRTVLGGAYAISLAAESTNGNIRFAFCRRADAQTAASDAQAALKLDTDVLAAQVLDWYQACPPCPNPHFETLWYKCLSVNRVNVFTPQDGNPRYRTTPTRPVKRDEAPWDACFHATAMVHYAPALAVDTVLSLLGQQRADGSIPHDADDITQPPLLCSTVWNLFEATGDTALLKNTAEALRRYVGHELSSRRSPNGLMTRRSDTAEPIDAVDLSVFTAIELLCLHRIYLTLGDHASALQMENMHRDMVGRINGRLWDERSHCYYDRTRGGVFRRSLTPASFLPLYAGICDPRQAHCLLTNLAPLLDLPFPIPSETDDERTAHGGVWLHTNYFLYVGLQRYGFGKQASALRQKTLDGVNRHFRCTGSIPEIYDPNGGDPPCPAADSNRSASFIELFLWS